MEVKLHAFITSTLDGHGGQRHAPGVFPPVRTGYKAGWTQSRSRRCQRAETDQY